MWISSKLSRFTKQRGARGFTLVELLTVAAIIIIITSILLLKQTSFNSSTLLRSLAYSISLSVRQAQIYGTSIAGTTAGGSQSFAPGYGLHFDAASTGTYILFGDLNKNGIYDTSPVNEMVQMFRLGRGYRISEVCALRTNGNVKDCTGVDNTGSNTITWLDMVFRRPNPDACFTTDQFPNECTTGASQRYGSAYIQISAATGPTRSVLVTTTGQITVQPPGTLP